MTRFKTTNNFFIKPLLIIIVTLFFTACETKKGDIDALRKQLAGFKKDQRELTLKIDALEKDIAKLDTSMKVEVKPKLIGVETLQKSDFNHFIEVQGTVDAEQNALAIQQMPGIVNAIFVKEGDVVKKGQVLYTTDASTYGKQIETINTQLELARTAFEKQKRLWDQNIGSEIQFLQAKTNKDALEKQVSTLNATIELTKCKSPIDGTVDEVRVKLGDMAAPSAMQPGIRVINTNSLIVRAKMAEGNLGKISKGDQVMINFPDINKTIQSTVTYVGQVINAQTRTFGVEVKLDNSIGMYSANMIAKLMIKDDVEKNVLIVPSNIIQKTAKGDQYVLVAEGKTAKKVAIETGSDYNGKTVVTEGLNAGDKIITFGYSEVVDGQAINY